MGSQPETQGSRGEDCCEVWTTLNLLPGLTWRGPQHLPAQGTSPLQTLPTTRCRGTPSSWTAEQWPFGSDPGQKACGPLGSQPRGSPRGWWPPALRPMGGGTGARAQLAVSPPQEAGPRAPLLLQQDPSHPGLFQNFTKGVAQARGLSPLRLQESEPDKRHGNYLGGPLPHSPKLKDMSRDDCHQQEALWELLTTELIYVRKLKIMTDLLAAGLLNLQRVNLLTEVSVETLFGTVPSLIRAHRSFWDEVLGPTLEKTRASGQPLDPLVLHDGFLTFSQRFQPYTEYCLRVKRTMAYARDQQDRNPLFHSFVQWCEKHKRSGRQMLGDLLIKPHQRITKYPLLLRAVLKRTSGGRARDALASMIAAVESFLQHINKQVRQGEEQESLVAAAQRLGPYEVLEPTSEEVEKSLRPFCNLDLMSPMVGVSPEHTRQLLLEGPVRVKEGREGKLDVYLFLFSDVLLVTKPQRKADKANKAKVIRPPLMLEKLVCRPLRDPSSFLVIHLSDLQCLSTALSIHCPSAADRTRWLDKTQQAQVALQKLKEKEYTEQKRKLLALYRDQDSSSTRPSTPIQEGSQNNTEERTAEFSTIVPQLVVTEDTDEDTPSGQEDTLDSGYGTLIPDSSPKGSPSLLSRLRPRALRRDPRLTLSTLDLRDIPLHPQPLDPQASQRRSAPELPEETLRRGGSLPRGCPPPWCEGEVGAPEGGNVVAETLRRALLRGQPPCSPTHTDSAGESPWETSEEEEEEEWPVFPEPAQVPSPQPVEAEGTLRDSMLREDVLREDRLREIREELASQRIEGAPDPKPSRPRRLTRAQLARMRGLHVIQLDTPVSTSEA
ncbi:pleckstrin homology domain-containing family G member 6 isoform X2 [Erinaceus europaeus]|uniref:Pleckstrin homology domain-containing family G member 6 isoform X2 n=1 Tax=Erinaceus europaeus TaxID=9365 RepID=A0ABM3XBK9_ERIEU|nr:pleckstrin homology domain-containing family G member 6 isoform X2 [Erinaceus europaeus]